MTTPRLPPLPDLDWKPDGTPVAAAMDDVYYSAENGLEETRAVYLAACGLPERWSGRENFTVAELGFGTGLNLLALWQMWRTHRPSPTARLNFVSFEGFPMTATDAARALSRWPELAEFSKTLIARWPERARGVQQIALTDGLTFTLHIDDIASALPNSQFKADAWFLDGFSPAKNSAMWAPGIYPLLAERSAPGAKIGTFTVAGAVRRGLAEAGLTVSKQAGFGRKRDRLEAIVPEPAKALADPYRFAALKTAPKTVAIVGAGIAGASLAHAFAGRAKVTLFDRAPGHAQGASGNPLALLMPRLDAGDTGPARALLASYLFARNTYKDQPGTHSLTVEHRPRNETDKARFAKLHADPPFSPDLLSAHPSGGLAHHGALILEPKKLIEAMLAPTEQRYGAPCQIDMDARSIDGETFDMIVLANGMGISRFAQTDWLPLEARLGQVETGRADHELTAAIAAGHYALALGQTRLWGATFTPFEGDIPEMSADMITAASAENDAALTALALPGWNDVARRTTRAGLRATTPDKLPFAGPAPNFKACVETLSNLRNGIAPSRTPPTHEGIWLLGGLGARGFTFAPWLAAHIAACAFNTPSPMGRTEAKLISPLRFIYRGLKRKAF